SDLVEGLVLPALVEGRAADAKSLLRRADFSSVDEKSLPALETLFGAAAILNDPDLMLAYGRQWIQGAVHHGPGGSRSWVVENVLDRCSRVLDDELEWTLAQSVVTLLLDERLKEKVKDVVRILPSLQRKFERPLLEPTEVTDLLVERFSGSPWGAGLMFEMIPPEDRTRVLRTVWSKVAKTQRASFVLNVAAELDGDVAPAFEDLLVESFVAALEETDADDFLRYRLLSLAESGDDPALAGRLLDAALEHGLEHLSLTLWAANLEARRTSPEEALRAALEAFREALEASEEDRRDWQTRSALGRLYARFLPESSDRFLEVVDDVIASSGGSPELTGARLDVAGAAGTPDEAVDAVRAALEEHPDDETLLRRLDGALNRAGRAAEALDVLERIVEVEEDERQRERDRGRLVRGWTALRHPIRALAALEAEEDDEEEEKDEDREEAEAARERKLAPATIDALKEAVDAGEEEAARRIFRRLWRGDASGRGVVRYVVVGGVVQRMGGGFVPPFWPDDDEEEDEPEARERDRGGLPDWVTAERDAETEDEGAEEEERTRTIDVLLAHGFGRDETWRRLRTMTGAQLGRETETFDALAADLARREGRTEASRRLLARIQSGAGGLIEHALVLALVARDPEAIEGSEREMLADVLRTVPPDDASALRRLARVFASVGDLETATRLFRWCATRTDAGGFGGFGGSARIPARSLIDDVRQSLDGEARLAVVDAILAWAEPGDMTWQRESYEELALSTWEDLLGPAGALERGRAICESVLRAPEGPYEGWRRRTAKRAARLFACAGELDLAERALEVATARMEAPGDGDVAFSYLPGGGITFDVERGMGFLGREELLDLFPPDDDAFVDREARLAWFGRAGEAFERWAGEERVRRLTAVQALVVVSVRLAAAGEEEGARARLEAAERIAEDLPDPLLWVADARRRLGDEADAARIERSLFDRGVLHPERAPDVVERILRADGPEEATRRGEEVLVRSHHPRLIELLGEAARASGDAERAERFATLAKERDEAEREVEARLEAKRKETR
ncbi:MAG: hypothetical protein ACF8XB_13555, partial [Planctomycetota bacterium JB042]